MKKTDTLKDIITKKKERLLAVKQILTEDELKSKIQGLPVPRPFISAINKPRQISLIAEIKMRSPSRGGIRENFNLREIAQIYQDAGVQAVSVLTEEDYFGGDITFINQVKEIVTVPVLRKDFIFEPYQVYESRFYGADAILLIAELFSKESLSQLLELAGSLGLACLVETHNEKDIKKALSLKAEIIGINNRDLHTLEVDLKNTERFFPLIPKDKIVVVESGLKKRADVSFLKILGAQAVLIGEAFMEASDIRIKIEELMGW